MDKEEDSGGENPHIAKVHYDLYARDANSQVMAIYKRGVTHEEDGQDPTITDCLKLKFKPVFVVHGCTVELTICKDNMTFMPDGRSFKFNQPIDYTFPTTSPCAGSRFIIPANTVINYNPKNKSANGFFTGVWGYGMALNIDLPINIFGGGTETVSATLESVITISNISLMPKLAEWHIYGNDQQGRFVTRKPDAEPLYYLDNLTNDVKNKNFFRILDKKEYELKDHLGNVRVAIGDMKLPVDPAATYPARGAGPFFVDEKAINDYYPFGMTIADRSWSTGNYRYGYGGHEQDNEVKGTAKHLSFGDHGYDPRIGRRWDLDPMAETFSWSSPYSTVFNNPIFFKDSDGEVPTPLEAAYMAQYAYNPGRNSQGLIGGWKAIDVDNKDKNGFKSVTFMRKLNNGKYEYTYAFAGTENLIDWKNNFAQIVGLSGQYDKVKNTVQSLIEKYGAENLTLTGHSLGGGLAAYGSMLTGVYAMTFNPATVSILTTKFSINKDALNINSFITEGDPLTKIQDGLLFFSQGKRYNVEAEVPAIETSVFYGLFKINTHIPQTMLDPFYLHDISVSIGGLTNLFPGESYPYLDKVQPPNPVKPSSPSGGSGGSSTAKPPSSGNTGKRSSKPSSPSSNRPRTGGRCEVNPTN